MKVGVFGKGGVGKTTIAAILSREMARRGRAVVALDCDTNPNLGIALGLPPEATERLVAIRQALEEGKVEHAPGAAELLERFGTEAPDGIRLAVVNRIENPNPG